MASPTCYADEIRDDFEFECESADVLLRDIVLRDQTPTYAETVTFKQKMGWDEKTIRDQLRRMHNVLRLQAIAGSPANREATIKEAETSAAVLENKRPKLLDTISKAEAELKRLEDDARKAAKRADEQRDATMRLRTLPTNAIREKVNHAVNAIENTIGRQILDMGARIGELECWLDPSQYPNEQAYLEGLQRSFRPAVIVNEYHRRALSPEWPAIRSGIQRELAELKEQIEPLKVQRQQMTEQAEKPLDFYSDPENWNN